ncbi:hypothetical protein J22TS1_48380 [Siminovitchia terrae]|uniref:AAA family ATPase n=1 Tax=Siminovitchia terrae TaxID=1914933 RepID=UPI001B262BB2|nr:AAA family ATPase [Siminovitchia terrae]GIN93787.1 hypothetical protein J22TS1_48380 [Siminovitchia terrae]
MKNIDLLYINYLDHPWLSGLELNFSQDMSFKLVKDKIIVSYLKTKNMFNMPISNLNVIIGKNGVGKTTIINEIFDLLHGSVEKDRIVAIRKNKEIFIYVSDRKINLSYGTKASELDDYRFYIKDSGFYLDSEETKSRNEVKNLIYISEFTDLSVNSISHKYEENHAFNYSPFFLINSPNAFLSYSNYLNNTLEKSISNFQLISKIHQIDFLANDRFNFEFKKPTSVQIDFSNFNHKLDRRIKSKSFGNKGYLNDLINNIIQREAGNSLKLVYDVHIILSLWNVLEISKNYIDKEKAQKHFKNDKDIEELLNKKLKDYNEKLHRILIDFSQGKSSLAKTFTNYKSLLDASQLSNFYSNINGEDIDIVFKFDSIVQAYNYVTKVSLQNLNKNSTRVDLSLESAGKFLERYLTLRNYAEFNNEAFLCMPDKIDFFHNNNIFYFSSGQEQLIRLFTYIYLSVENINQEHKSFIVLMDEPNNAFHPEMQKQFVKSLNAFLGKFEDCSFHIILTTHSPIIASDLTNNHIIFLEQIDEGDKVIRSIEKNKPKTFAQNIYNLYKESFFIEDGLIGSYADEVLSKVYKQLSKSKEKVYDDSYIEQYEGKEIDILDIAIDQKKKGVIKATDNEVEAEYNDEEIRFYITEIGEPIIQKKFEDIYNRTTRISLINKVIDDKNMDSEIKEEIVSLILKQRGNFNDRN